MGPGHAHNFFYSVAASVLGLRGVGSQLSVCGTVVTNGKI